MTYNALMGTLNPTHSLTHSLIMTFNDMQPSKFHILTEMDTTGTKGFF